MKPSQEAAFSVISLTISLNTHLCVFAQPWQAVQSAKGALPMKIVSVSIPSSSKAVAA